MTFTYCYRDKTGAKKESVIEAKNRVGAIILLKEQGIVLLSIKETGLVSNAKSSRLAALNLQSFFSVKSLLFLISGVLITIYIGRYFIRIDNQNQINEEHPKSYKQIMPKDVHTAFTANVRNDESPSALSHPKPMAISRPDFFSKPRSEWTSREKALAMQYWIQDTNNIISGIDMRTRIPSPAYSNAVQGLLAAYTIPGADCIPFGPISDAEARKIISTKITYCETDSDELVEQKNTVAEMLGELKEYMDNGGHAQEYFRRLEERQSLESDTMAVIRDEVSRLRNSGDYEGAKAALDKYNEYLRSKGLPLIRMKTGPGRKKLVTNTKEG